MVLLRSNFHNFTQNVVHRVIFKYNLYIFSYLIFVSLVGIFYLRCRFLLCRLLIDAMKAVTIAIASLACGKCLYRKMFADIGTCSYDIMVVCRMATLLSCGVPFCST